MPLEGRARRSIGLAAFIAISAVIAAIGSAFTGTSVDDWYRDLAKPAWTPPAWLFGPVWSVLYVLIGVSAWLVWRRRGLRDAAFPLLLWAVQLLLNLAWSGIFFGLREPGAALIEIVVLWGAILATIFAFWRVSRPAAMLLLPYLAWVTFAAALNFEIWRLNLPA